MHVKKPGMIALAIVVLAVSVPIPLSAQASGPKTTASEIESVTVKPEGATFNIKVSAGKLDRKKTIVRGPIWFEGIKPMYVVFKDSESGKKFTGQIAKPPYRDVYEWSMQTDTPPPGEPKKMPLELSFILPELAAGKTMTVTATEGARSWQPRFKWHDDKLTQAELQNCGRPVLRYMYEPVDDGSPKRRQATYKVYHHVYSPEIDQPRLLTKGPGGLFPHHRGIFFGFNRITYGDGEKADIWHCKNGESQVSQQVTNQRGPVSARTWSTIQWNGQKGTPFAVENREITAYRADGATVLDFSTQLRSLVGPLKLDGDPQHAGVQFRASQEIPDKTRKLTYYIRPDGKSKPGEFRNWSSKKNESEINKAHVNLPWLAMSIAFPQDGEAGEKESTTNERYTICYLDSATNPKPARFSERDYGRFGSYFATTVDTDKPLCLNYRYWILNGEAEVEQIQALSDQYANPVTFEVVKSTLRE